MANQVNLDEVSVSFGLAPVLDGVSLGVDDGDRIGVVGLNGSGKSTLLDVLSRRRTPDAGRVAHRNGLRVAMVSQRDELPAGATVRDVVLARLEVDAEHEWASDAQVRSVIEGLGLGRLGLDAPVGPLSGGERRRVALAAALVGDADLLVLDEPTNHLDLEGVRWLADYLIARGSGLVVVTHDRWFLDTVATRTWEVTAGTVQSYLGGYADWVYARAERQRQADSAEERRRNLARKELAWLRRGPQARTSKPKFRIDAANALIADVPPPRERVELVAMAQSRIGRTVLELEDVSLAFGERTILDDVTWRLGPGDRIGVLGANGSGKTTLLKVLSGQLPPDKGEVVIGQTVRLGQLSQALPPLPEDARVLTAVEEIARQIQVGKYELSASQLLERFGFASQMHWTPVRDLSGGQRRRLHLVRVLLTQPNVLILDEPTNDLDVDTLAALEDLLDSWAGTLIVVSHDRYLIERACDDVVALFGDGRLTHLPGGIDEYLARRAASGDSAPSAIPSGASAQPPAVSAAEQRAARKELQRLERRLASLTRREEQLHAKLVESATDFARLSKVDEELRAVRAEKDQIEQEWYAAAEQT